MDPSRINTQRALVAAVEELRIEKGLSREKLARDAGMSPGAISYFFNEKTLPHEDRFQKIIRALGQEPEIWSKARARAAKRRRRERESAKPPSQPGPPAPVTSATAPGSWLDELDFDRAARDFGVHPAIKVRGAAPVSTLLPPYVERAHDKELSDAVNAAAKGHSTAVFCVGTSSTGKSRACWEALKALLTASDRWRIWHPLANSRPQALIDGIDLVAPATVIWLNEAHLYLFTDPPEVGESVSTVLSDLVSSTSRGPVLILGSLPNRYAKQLLERSTETGLRERHPAARDLLSGRLVKVPPTFDDVQLSALKESGENDPRWAKALARAEEGMVIQYLAGGPALVERLDLISPQASSLVLAAADLVRLGVTTEAPLDLLVDAVPDYLRESDWNDLSDDWSADAVAEASHRVVGAVAPLTRIRPRPGQPADPRRFKLADFLAEHVSGDRADACPPASWWDACAGHLSGGDLKLAGVAAKDRWLLPIARHGLTAAHAAGDASAALLLGDLLAQCGDLEGLERLALETRSADLFVSLATQRAWRREADQARAAWRVSIAEGGLELDRTLEYALDQCDEAYAWQYLADLREAGSEGGQWRWIWRLHDEGQPKEAAAEYRRLIDEGALGVRPRYELVRLLVEAGTVDDAIDYLLSDGFAASDLDGDWLRDFLSQVATPDLISQLSSALDGKQHALIDHLRLVTMDDDRLLELAHSSSSAADVLLGRLVSRHDGRGVRVAGTSLQSFSTYALIERSLRTGDASVMEAALEVFDHRKPDLENSLFLGERLASLLAALGETDRLRELASEGRGRRAAADWFYQEGLLDDLRRVARSSTDKFLRKRLAWLLADRCLTEELRDLAATSYAAARIYPEHLIKQEDWAEIGRLMVAGDGYMREALRSHMLRHPASELTAQAAAVKLHGFLPDGTIAPQPS